MDCCNLPGLMPFEQGIEALLAGVKPVAEVETVLLAEALGRVLAKPVAAAFAVPSFDNSAMDGYALRFADLAQQVPLPVQATVFAGKPITETLLPNHCMRIMTGAAIPKGADTVVMQENVDITEQGITLFQETRLGANVRYSGEDIKPGATVVAAGQQISPAHIALLASVGCANVEVYRRTRVALISTGDELKKPGETLGWGDIYNSNGPAIMAMLNRLNVEVIDYGILADDAELFRQTFLAADASSDFVLTSGGVSVGEADYTKDVLEQLGSINFWKLAIKPGKPFAFGELPNSYFIGLPGNPVSALVTFHVLASQAIRHHQRVGHKPMHKLNAVLQTALRKSPGRMDFQRGVWSLDDKGAVIVNATRTAQGSHILTSIAQANCYIALEQERADVNAGEIVEVWLFDNLMGG